MAAKRKFNIDLGALLMGLANSGAVKETATYSDPNMPPVEAGGQTFTSSPITEYKGKGPKWLNPSGHSRASDLNFLQKQQGAQSYDAARMKMMEDALARNIAEESYTREIDKLFKTQNLDIHNRLNLPVNQQNLDETSSFVLGEHRPLVTTGRQRTMAEDNAGAHAADLTALVASQNNLAIRQNPELYRDAFMGSVQKEGTLSLSPGTSLLGFGRDGGIRPFGSTSFQTDPQNARIAGVLGNPAPQASSSTWNPAPELKMNNDGSIDYGDVSIQPKMKTPGISPAPQASPLRQTPIPTTQAEPLVPQRQPRSMPNYSFSGSLAPSSTFGGGSKALPLMPTPAFGGGGQPQQESVLLKMIVEELLRQQGGPAIQSIMHQRQR